MARDVDLFAPLELAPWAPRAAGPAFDVEVVPGDDPVIRLRGELDLAAVGLFEGTAIRLLAEGRPRVVLDLRELDFLDVSGINALLGLARVARRRGAEVLLRAPSGAALDLLERTRSLELLAVDDE